MITQKWFTRFPQKVINSVYLSNITEATKFFMYWFSNGDITYTAMLIKMHEIVSKNGYSGYTCSSHNSPIAVINSFRNETTNWFPVLKKEWFTGIPNERIIKPQVKGIPAKQSHWLQNSDEGYILHLPNGKYVHNYLCLLSKLMNKIKSNGNLGLLANYLQLFVIGHPFKKINFSICMAQINAILDMQGYKTLYHEWMDFECFLYDYIDIESKFTAKLKKAN